MANTRPVARLASRISRPALLVLAALSVGVWLLVETMFLSYSQPRFMEMLSAARTMQAAMQVIREEKRKLDLLQPPAIDPNLTGLIGPEWSETTTTLGVLSSKRTATNPDLAAALVRNISALPIVDGGTAVVMVSGSFVGGNIAALAAVQALGLKTVLVSSLSASMWGATDLEFSWLDMEAALRSSRVLNARSLVAVTGGDSGVGASMVPEGRRALTAAAERYAVPLLDADSLDGLIGQVFAEVVDAAGGLGSITVFVNVGGAAIALGNCPEATFIPNGLITRPLPCSERTHGLIGRMASADVPVINILDLKTLAADYGLPYDPVPLPLPGDNRRVYGGR